MLSEEEKKKYNHRINNLDITLEETTHKYIMIHEWTKDNSHKWGIAVFEYNNDDEYWYLKTFSHFPTQRIDWYDFGCLVNLGFKWIKELGWG